MFRACPPCSLEDRYSGNSSGVPGATGGGRLCVDDWGEEAVCSPFDPYEELVREKDGIGDGWQWPR